ncbi:MAG: glutamate racemase [Alphaproteobacteria bacterium]
MRVAFLDSGVGALSILQAVLQQFPALEATVLADDAFYPYGTKNSEDLIERLVFLSKKLVANLNPSALIIACNTASTVVLPALRANLSIPVIGVVPAIKPAAAISITKTIGLLATKATVNRPYMDNLIAEHAPHCHVIRVGCSELVDLAEAKLQGHSINPASLQPLLTSFFPEGMPATDVIVLGCTHFPLLSTELAIALQGKNYPAGVTLLDSGSAIARRLGEVLNLTFNQAAAPAHPFDFMFTEGKKLNLYTPALVKMGCRSVSVFTP